MRSSEDFFLSGRSLYGVLGSPDFSRSDGINIDLWWGLVMLVFGLLMGVGGYIAARRNAVH